VVPAALVVTAPATARAQISPGPLARAHERLEGSGQCLKCHDQKGVSPEKCLGCHTLLATRIAGGKGLHARADHRDCKRCHVEHQGRDFELVFWGDPGRPRFDHTLTGYPLRGRHGKLDCDECHRRRLRLTSAQLAAGGAGAHSMLGLEPACMSCHPDEHRGQFAGRDCTTCHGQESWKPATGFDHQRAAFRLEGRHSGVACDRCHPAAPAAGPGRGNRRYTKLSFGQCSSCHRDPHAGRLGPACSSCHGPASWSPRSLASFDHDRTRYPLRGRHRSVACESCHRPREGFRLGHGQCRDCHADAHFGQLEARSDGGRCEACHDVNGFVPAAFGSAEHAKTRYPLAGAHLAVACDACHSEIAAATLVRTQATGAMLAPAKATTTARLRFASTRCSDCHQDRHAGEVARYLKTGGCEACHLLAAWSSVRFDHSQARFALTGAHASVACERCHLRLDAGTPRQRPRLRGLEMTCQGCHRDPHGGELTRPGLASPCERCHTTASWAASRFDHNRETSYPLDGAHARLACAACHRKETRAGATVLRFKPLGKACKDCHGAQPPGSQEKRP
jgi:hypothetical protein